MAKPFKNMNAEERRGRILCIALLSLTALICISGLYFCLRSEGDATAAAEDPENYYYQKYTPTISKPEVDSINAAKEAKMDANKQANDNSDKDFDNDNSAGIPIYTNDGAEHHEEVPTTSSPAPKEETGGYMSTEELESQF